MKTHHRLLALGLLACLFFLVDAQPDLSYSEALLYSSKPAILLPGIVQISTIGMMGDGGFNYKLHNTEYQRYLGNLYHFISPYVSGEQNNILFYFVRYQIEGSGVSVTQLEQEITDLIFQQVQEQSPRISDGVISIQRESISSLLESSLGKSHQFGASSNRYLVFLLNSSFQRIKEALLSKSTDKEMEDTIRSLSGYNWLCGKVSSNTWIDSNFVVIDIAAESVYLGPYETTSGIRNPMSVPYLQDYIFNDDGDIIENNIVFEASLGGAIHSLVESLFFPSVGYNPYINNWSHIYVPIMIFKNHKNPVQYDQSLIEKQIKSIFHKSITVEVEFGTHSLHDHKHLSMAVSKSMSTHITNQPNEKGIFQPVGRQYLDSQKLSVELRRSYDALAGLLMDETRQANSKGKNKMTLPVYIFSLHGLDPELLLDNFELVSAFHDSIIILSTDQENVSIPFRSDSTLLSINATDFTRHVVAGVAMNQGVTVPYKRSSELSEDGYLYDYSWAIGSHPFGYFSDSAELSPIFIGNIRRNAVVSRVHKGLSLVRESITELDDFAEEHFHGVLESSSDFSSWMESIYHGTQAEDNPLFYTETVDRIQSQTEQLVVQLKKITDSLKTFKIDDAFGLSQSFLYQSNLLWEYTKDEIEQAEVRLHCCNVVHVPPVTVFVTGFISMALSVIALFLPLFFLVFYFAFRSSQVNKKKQQVIEKRKVSTVNPLP